MKLRCVRSDDYNRYECGNIYEVDEKGSIESHYKVITGDGDHWFIDKESLSGPGVGTVVDPLFEIVEDSGNNERESKALQTELPSLEQISEWCQKADVDVTMTGFGTFNVFDRDTERQCEITDPENLVQLLQIMVSYKESLESFGRWV